jgi:dihydroorotate dehydrogenase
MTREFDPRRALYDPAAAYDQNYRRGPGERWIADTTPSDPFDPATAHRFAGADLRRPFGIPAGPLLNAAYVEAAFRNGFDLNVYKTVRSLAYPVHPAPNVLSVHVPAGLTGWGAELVVRADTDFRAPLSICNSFGVPSREPDEWQPDLQRAVAAADPGQATIGSFQATPRPGAGADAFIADHAATARLVVETGAPIIELDASCPNEGSGNLLCFDAATLARACGAIKDAVGDVPLGVKISAFADDERLRAVVRETGGLVAYYAAINTLPATLVDADGRQALPGDGRAVGGVCGAAILPAALDMVTRLTRLRDELGLGYEVLGVGGVGSAEDSRRMVGVGADAVMSATAAMWNPDLAAEVAPAWEG